MMIGGISSNLNFSSTKVGRFETTNPKKTTTKHSANSHKKPKVSPLELALKRIAALALAGTFVASGHAIAKDYEKENKTELPNTVTLEYNPSTNEPEKLIIEIVEKENNSNECNCDGSKECHCNHSENETETIEYNEQDHLGETYEEETNDYEEIDYSPYSENNEEYDEEYKEETYSTPTNDEAGYTLDDMQNVGSLSYYGIEENDEIEENSNNILSLQENTVEDNNKTEIDLLKTENFEINLSDSQKYSLEKFLENWEENKERYQYVEDMTNVPKELVAAIHWREGSGDFDTYLHNGQNLGEVTTIAPSGVYFENWEDAAVDALLNYGPNIDNINLDDMVTLYDYAEYYNGLGYYYMDKNSPYVWAGTENFNMGRFVADGEYDPTSIDEQPGVAVLLDAIME